MSEAVIRELNLDEVLKDMKDSYEEQITDPNGNPGEYIKSQKLIKKLHKYIVSEFISKGIDDDRIIEEKKLYGKIKYKDQDICIMPNDNNDHEEILITWGEEKHLGKKCEPDKYIEKILSINVRSQLSSLMKNKDTLFERTFAEALNFHLRCPNMCLGEIYLIPVYEYNNEEFENNKVDFIKTIKYDIDIFKDVTQDELENLASISANDNLATRDIFINMLNKLNIIPKVYELYLEENSILDKYNVKRLVLGKNPPTEKVKDIKRHKLIREELKMLIKELKEDISKVISIRSRIERYINFFDEINLRKNTNSDYHKYERCALLIVDFSQEDPRIYGTTEELKQNGLVGPNFSTEISKMNIDDFASDLIEIYNNRF